MSFADAMQDRPTPQLRTHQADGIVRYPLIVLAGEQGAGKSHNAALAAGSDRFGSAYWLEWGSGDEGIGDEYGAIPGANHLVIDHDGTWHDIMGQIYAAKVACRAELEQGGPPPVLVVDSLSAAWDQVKNWTYRRAMHSRAGRKQLADDPDAAVDVGRNLWNDARSRYRELMTQLLSWPGVVITTARAAEVSGTDDNGRPTNTREWRMESHGSLASDATVIVRLDVGKPVKLVKLRSANPSIQVDTSRKPVEFEHLDVPWLVFDVMQCAPGEQAVRTVTDQFADRAESEHDGGDEQPSVAEGPQAQDVREQRQQQSQQAIDEYDWNTAVADAASNDDPQQALEDLRALWYSAKSVEPNNSGLAELLKGEMSKAVQRSENAA